MKTYSQVTRGQQNATNKPPAPPALSQKTKFMQQNLDAEIRQCVAVCVTWWPRWMGS